MSTFKFLNFRFVVHVYVSFTLHVHVIDIVVNISHPEHLIFKYYRSIRDCSNSLKKGTCKQASTIVLIDFCIFKEAGQTNQVNREFFFALRFLPHEHRRQTPFRYSYNAEALSKILREKS